MMTEETKQAVDVFAASTGVMSLAAWLPPTMRVPSSRGPGAQEALIK